MIESHARLDKLQNEINRLTRSLLSSIHNKYSKRILIREYKLKFLGDVFVNGFEMELKDEELKALVRIRKDKIKELQTKLEKLH